MKAALALLMVLGTVATPAAAQAQAEPAPAVVPPAAADEAAKPAPGFILYRSQRRMSLVFRRELSPAEEETEIAEARLVARRQYEQNLADWQERYGMCGGTGIQPYRCDHAPSRPRDFSEEDAGSLLDPESAMINVDRRQTAADVAGTYVYLVEASPGSYVLYGQRDLNGGHPEGVCLCMGSLRFDVAVGQVVDLGTITFPGLEAANARPSERQAMTTAMENSIVLVPAQPGVAPPAIVGDRPLQVARLRAADKQDNVFGLYIDRHPAMAGVLRYERDRVIDERTGTDPAQLAPPVAP